MDAVEKKYRAHRANAKFRGVEWVISLEEWWSVWRESGKWEQRGCRHGQYVMARCGDVGPYRLGNVYICLASQNASDGMSRRHRLGALSR
jgi:hypothetical protein